MSSSTPSLSPSSTSPPSFSPDLAFQTQTEEEGEEIVDSDDQQKNPEEAEDGPILNGHASSSPQISHEKLFETIAKLAGIDGPLEEEEEEEGANENENNECGGGGGEKGEAAKTMECAEQMNGHHPMGGKETSTPPNGNAASNHPTSSSSSSSSRRKNGNPTRISDAGECKMIGRNEGDGVKMELDEGGKEIGEENDQEDEGGECPRNGPPPPPPSNHSQQSTMAAANLATINQQFGIGLPPPPFPPHPQFPPFVGFHSSEQANDDHQQRRFYAQLMQQAQSGQAQQQQSQMLEMQRNFAKLTQNLKEELSGIFGGTATNGALEKPDAHPHVLGGDLSAATEAQAHAGRLLAALSLAARHHQWAAEQLGQFSQALAAAPRPPPFAPAGRIFPPRPLAPAQPPTNPFHAFLAQTPLMAAMAAAQQQHFPGGAAPPMIAPQSNGGGGGGGIFPSNGFVPPPRPPQQFGGQIHHQNGHQMHESDGSPRKKRAKVTDSVRGPRSSLHPCREPAAANSSHSERSTPQGAGCGAASSFAPTMVPLASQLLFRHPAAAERGAIPEGGSSPSGDDSEGGNSANGEMQPHRTQLTHVHLRKAKLMFFYQRYPNSALLKSYFPDIHFNKHNTAQLIKWFSNFREFFYMQMEKYAKQALAEGVRHREELLVTQESEIFKQLNIHYNKNSIFPPPDRLQFVVQETLREFFCALQQKKDTEPSWKKAIYKIIQQLDEPIPEWFKHQEFVEMLERTT